MSNPVGAQAQVPQAQQTVNTRLLDNHTNPITNEGNLLSLITLQQVLGREPQNEIQRIVQGMAKEETRYLVQAMKILTGDIHGIQGNAQRAGVLKLREKYGRDMDAALKLGEVLKARGDSKAVDLMFNPFVMDSLRSNDEDANIRGGFRVPPGLGGNHEWPIGTTADAGNTVVDHFAP